MKPKAIAMLMWAVLGSLSAAALYAQDKVGPNQSDILRDYFFYQCVHKFPEVGDFSKIDGSAGLAAEYLSIPAEAIMALSSKAKNFAESIPRSEYTGRYTVLWSCLEESRKLDTQQVQGAGRERSAE